MAVIRLLLVAALALQALIGLGNAVPSSQTSQGATHATPPPTCPENCPKIKSKGTHNYGSSFYFTPLSSSVNVKFYKKTPLGPLRMTNSFTANHSQVKHVSEPPGTLYVSGPILYCNGENIDRGCLSLSINTPTTTTSSTTTTPTTSTPTTSMITTTTNTTTITEGFQKLEMFLLILSGASVLLWMLLVVKNSVTYCRTLAGLDRRIASAREQGADVSTRLLYSLRDALVLNFGLWLCLCLLLPCLCVCAFAMYLTISQDSPNNFVVLYIPGAACLLLHGFFCTKKVNSVIKKVIGAHQRPLSTSRRRRDYTSSSENNSVSENTEEMQGCPNQAVVAVLKVCLLLLLLCLCVLSYGLVSAWERLGHPRQQAREANRR